MDSNLDKYLNDKGIYFKQYFHQATFTVKESMSIRKDIPGEIVKSLFLKDEFNQFYLVCLHGEKRLDTKKLKSFFSRKSITFASEEELKSALNVSPGSVSIFSILNSKEVILVIDKELLSFSSVGFHPNKNTSTLVLSGENLEKFIKSISSNKYILSL